MDGKKLGGIGLSIILIGVAVWLRVNRRSDDSEIVKSDMMQVVAKKKESQFAWRRYWRRYD